MVNFRVNKRIIFRTLNDKSVMLDPESGKFYSLNESASFLWHQMLSKKSSQELADALTRRFGIAKKKADKDVAELLTRLEKNSLIERA